MPFVGLAIAALSMVSHQPVSPYSLNVAPLPEIRPLALDPVWSVSPTGHKIEADNVSLKLDGKRVLWSMGEFHYARVPESEWRTELLKMKAGGIDIVSTYVFWIHHEEVEGKWDWSGRRDLRKFVKLAGEVGLKVFVRGGPWAHGECRNGGLPDWVVKRYKVRTDDPGYMSKVQELYDQIGKQVKGLMWKDGGPIIGFQVENEFYGPGEYLGKLKDMAVSSGMKVPLFTRTGWPALTSPVPGAAVFPVYGGYPVGFWDRGTDETAKIYAKTYLISPVRNPDLILQGKEEGVKAVEEDSTFPYLCCEIGGGMATSYHRRVIVEPDEVTSLAFVKLASGNNLMGYYMYHGGMNPDGALTYLNETQATNYWNDVPVKDYDFQAPIGSAGQVREHYHWFRRLHLFLQDFGDRLAGMPASFPENEPKDPEDTKDLRWSVRSDGRSGFVFVNNFQRLYNMTPKKGVSFHIGLKDGSVDFPPKPVSVPADTSFFWPFNMDLDGLNLRYATVQPICKLSDGKRTSYFFAETKGVVPQLHIDANSDFKVNGGLFDSPLDLAGLGSGLTPVAHFEDKNGKVVDVYVMSEAQSLRLWKGKVGSRDTVAISSGPLVFDDGTVSVSNAADSQVDFLPAPRGVALAGNKVKTIRSPGFEPVSISGGTGGKTAIELEKLSEAGTPRAIKMGSQGVAEQPSDEDFKSAAAWKLKVPVSARKMDDPVLHLEYEGDAMRLYLNGKLIEDNFFTGRPVEVKLKEFGPDVFKEGLELRILPLVDNAPIYFAPGRKPDTSAGPVAKVKAAWIRGSHWTKIESKH